MDLSLRLISKRTNRAPERSYCDRSGRSTNAAAARSLLKAGIFFFEGINLLFVHVAGADGPDQKFLAFPPKRENDEYAAPFFRAADPAKTILSLRVARVRKNGQRARKKAFDDRDRKAVLLAFGAVGPVPVEAIRLQNHGSRLGMQLYRQMRMAASLQASLKPGM